MGGWGDGGGGGGGGGGGKFVCVSGSCGCVGFALLMILEFHPLLCAEVESNELHLLALL